MEQLEHLIEPGVVYIHKVDHRNGNPHKSQWTIIEADERTCFHRSRRAWGNPAYCCWGLHLVNEQAEYLGMSKRAASEQRRLFIAKFVDGNRNGKWHGYPADHVANQQDIPPEIVLGSWLRQGHLPTAVIRKVLRGQKCRL